MLNFFQRDTQENATFSMQMGIVNSEFRHNNDTARGKLREVNSKLKQTIEDLKQKYDKIQLDLGNLMESQSNQEFLKSEHVMKEMEVFQQKFDKL